MKQKPSHQFYMQDFLSSPDVQMMSAEEVGCYTLLLFNLYVNGGQIENDAMALPMLCRGTKPSQKVMKKFYEDNGFLKHKRVDEELKKLAKFSKSQSNNARKRWSKATEGSMPPHSHRNAKVDASAIPSESPRGVSSSTSSSTSLNKENKKKENQKISIRPPDVSPSVWSDFLHHREKKKAPVTETVLKGIKSEAEKAGWTLEQAIVEVCARGWQGFKAEWVNKEGEGKSINPLAFGGYN